jgi:DNA-directed RNA polymerase subunit K/omega
MDASELIQQEDADSQNPIIPAEPLPPIQSRFLFVDVAALRAKQLRRGARIRFDSEPGIPAPHKPERVAMEEVRRGLVFYQVLPAGTGSRSAGDGA